MVRPVPLLIVQAITLLRFATVPATAAETRPATRPVFAIQVLDDQTNRGVPLVELKTVDNVRYYTDSNGIVAIDSPELFGRRAFFNVRSDGYEFPADGFGIRGRALEVRDGAREQFRIKRLNIGERLYRVTGEGIYRDSVLAGLDVPIKHPLSNAQVAGQDSIQSIIYRGKIRWFWGDTNRLAYPLGHFGMAGATSLLPADGGLDPSKGIDLDYFVNKDGFSRPMVDLKGQGPKWIDALMLLKDPDGRERLVTHCQTMKDLGHVLARDLLVYDDDIDLFKPLKQLPVNGRVHPGGHPFRHSAEGIEYYYFPTPYATLRVKANWSAVQDPSNYEAFSCLEPGTRFDRSSAKVERNADGKAVWAWKRDTDPINESDQQSLTSSGKLKADEKWFDAKDTESGKTVRLHGGSIAYNPFRKRWIMIAVEAGGSSSYLGEVWYTESDRPEGPWRKARKILTHDRYSFYNPRHHPFLDQQDGKAIYFEGTYASTFSRKGDETPRYDYNQIMYRLDLSDARLKAVAAD